MFGSKWFVGLAALVVLVGAGQARAAIFTGLGDLLGGSFEYMFCLRLDIEDLVVQIGGHVIETHSHTSYRILFSEYDVLG